MERQPQRFCPPSELGNPQRTRVSTFPQRRRLRRSNWSKLLNPRQSYISTDSRAEPKLLRGQLHRPDGPWPHVHAGTIHSFCIVSLGRAEKISTIFPDDVVNAACGMKCLVAHSLRQHMRSDGERCT